MNSPTPKPLTDDLSLYLTDNGRVACGRHLGSSARYTGRDISGQRIERVTDATARSWHQAVREPIKCEDCGAGHLDGRKPPRGKI